LCGWWLGCKERSAVFWLYGKICHITNTLLSSLLLQHQHNPDSHPEDGGKMFLLNVHLPHGI
jgi:hypothetical protein